MNEIYVTLVGNIGGGAPELRFTPDGTAVCKFRMACTPRKLDRSTNQYKDGDPSWYQVTAWRGLAENIAESLNNGDQVVVYGVLSVRQYEDRDGNKRTSTEVEAYAVGMGLQFATAKPVKASKGGNGGGQQQRQQGGSDSWGGAQPAQATQQRQQSAESPADGW